MNEEEIMKGRVIVTNDLITDLRKICYENTAGYRCDFDKDEEMILSEAVKPEGGRRTLLWMSYPNGTHLFYERDVFLEGSPANITWLFYDTQLKEAKKIAYAVWLDSIADGKVCGVLYELDFEAHCEHVRERMLPADYVRYIYERGSIECSAERSYHSIERARKEFGELIMQEYLPNDARKHLVTVATEQLYRDGSKVKIKIALKEVLEQMWKTEQEKTSEKQDVHCFRCGSLLDKALEKTSKSRYADCYICSDCGMDEALRDYPGCSDGPLNFSEWEFYRRLTEAEKAQLMSENQKMFLTSSCKFGHCFRERDPFSGRPESEAAYSRSDYDGYRWHTKWFLNSPLLDRMLLREAEGFMNALWAMPEFSNLYSLRRACSGAELTSSPTEYNLYGETYHFYVWIRINTRPKDYNLYVHYYKKSAAKL